jgi:hypothetical protein
LISKALIVSVLLGTCLLDVGAQQIQNQATTGLALEVVYLKGAAPAYQKIPWFSQSGGGTWYARFGRIAGWQPAPGQLPVAAVRLVPFFADDVVRIRVSVIRGIKFHETEDLVNNYAARENEKLTFEELKSFGVQPFEIKVVRVDPAGAALPSILNQTKSVEVISIEPIISDLPMYKLALHNLADKNISALKVNFLEGGRTVAGGMPQGADGKPLIGAGGFGELFEPLVTKAQPAPGGYIPSSPPAQQFAIATVVFEDGTYEGEAGAAAMYRGFVIGRKIELKRVVPVLEKALTTDPNAVDAPAKLRLAIESLSIDVAESDLAALVQAFPTLNKRSIRSWAEIAVHGVRKDLLDALQEFENMKAPEPVDFRSWLVVAKDRYANWLSRLSAAETISQR